MPTTTKLWDDYLKNPDPDLLRVYADALEQEGDARGQFLQLCLAGKLSEEQAALKSKLIAKSKKAIAGDGAQFLREYHFGANGLVAEARTEVGQVIAHVDEIARLNPRLVLTITSLKTQKDARALAEVSLEPIYFVDFGWITGTHGGMAVEDKIFDIIAPSLERVQHLQLSLRGEKILTPATLAKVGERLNALRYLAIDYYAPGSDPAPYAKAVSTGFESLRAFDFPEAKSSDLGGRKGLKLNPGLLESGRPSKKTGKAINEGACFVDLLEAVLA